MLLMASWKLSKSPFFSTSGSITVQVSKASARLPAFKKSRLAPTLSPAIPKMIRLEVYFATNGQKSGLAGRYLYRLATASVCKNTVDEAVGSHMIKRCCWLQA